MLQAKKDIAVITDKDKAMSILNHIIDSGHLHALDFETTGLSPKDGAEVVLVSISGPAWTGVFDLWAMDVPLDAYKEQWEAVDWVVTFAEDTPESLLKRYQPEVLVKGGDYSIGEVVGGEFVRDYGGKVEVLEFLDNCSTSAIVEKIQDTGQ